MSFCVFMIFMFFCIVLPFCGQQGCFPCSYVSSIAMRKSYIRSSLRTECWLSCFFLLQDIFWQNKSRLRHWTIKRSFDFWKGEKCYGVGPLTISWGGWQKRGFCSYVSSIAMRKSDLRSSCKSGKVTCWFYTFERFMLTDKSEEDRLRRWTLKWFLVNFADKAWFVSWF